MKASYNWLKELLDINHTPEELGEILTNTGLEVEHIETFSSIPGGLKGLVVGEVVSKKKHPNADRLSVAQVNVDGEAPLNIVCGASNLDVGQKVVVATVGTTIHPTNGEPFNINKAKLRGELSEGMICAEDEIGLGTDHEGIMVLDASVPIGTKVSELYNIQEDFVFEIGLTPNRTDAMGHIGIAKDIAAALNAHNKEKLQVKTPEVKVHSSGNEIDFTVHIENTESCPRYAGVVLKNLNIAESPDWLKNKLLAIGIRPINNVVDITNYVLKEFGQALHAFDLEAIPQHEIRVKNMQEGSSFITLDKVERKLSANDLMICNASEAMCMAGVFGGADSGVKPSTKAIFLESAYFDSASIRKTSTHHGLRTDAAQRYEKGADISMVIPALKRAVQLMEELAGAQVASRWIDEYPKKIEKVKITLRLSRLRTLSGHDFSLNQAKAILQDLDFEILESSDEEILLLSPYSRADVTREADVIEEVMRIFGFNHIAVPSMVKSTLSFHTGINKHEFKEKIAHVLNGFGFSEIMTNSISQSKYYERKEDLVMLQNSMTSELDCMRPSLVAEALQVIQHNINRKLDLLKFFEFGHTYKADLSQEEFLAIYYSGDVLESNWFNKKEKSSLFHLKGIIDALLKHFKLQKLEIESNENSLKYSYQNEVLVELRTLKEPETEAFDINQDVHMATFHLDKIIELLANDSIRFEAIPKFPKVSRDLAIVLDESIEFEALRAKIHANSGKLLKEVHLFDVFRSEEKVGTNKKSYALNFQLLDREKTLTDKEIDHTMQKIIRVIENEFNATIRS